MEREKFGGITHQVVYKLLGSLLSLVYVDLTPNIKTKPLRTEIRHRLPPISDWPLGVANTGQI